MAAHCEHVLMAPLWLLSWMRHEAIYSSCLVEDCWLRINGYAQPEKPEDARASRISPKPRTDNFDGEVQEEGHDSLPSENEDAAYDPVQPDANDPAFAQIGRILRQGDAVPATTRGAIMALSPAFDELGRTFPAAPVLHAWLIALHDVCQKCSTIRLNFFAIAHRLLAYCGDTSLADITQEDIELVREQLVEDGLGASTISNISAALNSLIRFLGQSGINGSLAQIPTGVAVAHANARIFHPLEIREVVELLSSARCKLAPNHRRAAQDLVVLCFHTGLRRQEAMHLGWHAVKGAPADILVRNTVGNRLKTIASRRAIPYGLLDLHESHIRHPLRRADSGMVIHIDATAKTVEMVPGSDRHRIFSEAIVREIHRMFRRLTGDDMATLHTLRHSCATTLLVLLLARRFKLHDIAPAIPWLQDILTPEAEQAAKDLICPESYQGDMELAAVRDVLGHASEAMTLAHYIHALELLRFALLRGEWIDDISAIGAAGGFSEHLCRQHTLDTLIGRLEKKSSLKITTFAKVDYDRYAEEYDKGSDLMRQMAIASSFRGDEAQTVSLLQRARHPYPSMSLVRSMMELRIGIEPMALRFLSGTNRASTLRSLMPISKWRDEALSFCDNIVAEETLWDDDERSFFRHCLCESIHEVLSNGTRLGSSVVRLPDENVLKALDSVCRHIIGVALERQSFFLWRKSGTSHVREPISLKRTKSLLSKDPGASPTLFVKLNFSTNLQVSAPDARRPKSRNALSTLTWVMATYYILYGSK
jgi:integrase